MKVVKMILKVALLPVIAVLWVVDLLANMLLTVGSYVLGPLMFFILCCGIYTVVKQLWNQTLLLALMEGLRRTACSIKEWLPPWLGGSQARYKYYIKRLRRNEYELPWISNIVKKSADRS